LASVRREATWLFPRTIWRRRRLDLKTYDDRKNATHGGILLLAGTLVAAGTSLVVVMLYGVPLSLKSHDTLKCYGETQKQRPC
jgi:hypothetical protein